MTANARFSLIFPKTDPALLHTIRLVQHRAAISAIAELLLLPLMRSSVRLCLSVCLCMSKINFLIFLRTGKPWTGRNYEFL